MLKYAGYECKIYYEDGELYGQIINIDDLVTIDFNKYLPLMQEDLKNTIKDYCRFCYNHGRYPDRPNNLGVNK